MPMHPSINTTAIPPAMRGILLLPGVAGADAATGVALATGVAGAVGPEATAAAMGLGLTSVGMES
jgi:hypothetical protein